MPDNPTPSSCSRSTRLLMLGGVLVTACDRLLRSGPSRQRAASHAARASPAQVLTPVATARRKRITQDRRPPRRRDEFAKPITVFSRAPATDADVRDFEILGNIASSTERNEDFG